MGREEELKRLEEFIQRPEPFIWQVLYGQHGVGKSRLAKEWLLRLEDSSPKWTVGFAPDEIKELDRLLTLRPIQATAIVIDSAENFGDELWMFLCRAQTTWTDYKCVVRILLLAHTDLQPLSASFERNQTLKALRESRLGQVIEVEAQTQPVKATELIPFKGIPLHPLQDQQDRKRILNSSGNSNISEDKVEKLIGDTSGLPAFLALAGRYPQDWNKKLEDYANVILEQAKELFGEENGIRVLALSTLIAPIDSSTLERIAPKAWSAKKMNLLFGSNKNTLKKEVPVFEPDLLGQEIIFKGLAMLSDANAESFCLSIAQECPDAFIQKTIEIWQRHEDPEGIVDKLGSDPGSLAQRTGVLNILFKVASQVSVYSINLPLGRLSQIRGKAYATALLNPSLPENQYSRLVDDVLAQTPIDGVSSYLSELHSEAPCDNSNHLKWVALLYCYCSSPANEVPPEIEAIKLANNNLNDSLLTTILQELQSSELFERSFAAFRLAEAMRNHVKSPDELIPCLVEVLDGLSSMLRLTAADRIAAAFAISRIAREPDGKPGWRHFRDNDTARLLAITNEHHSISNTFVTAAIALRDLWCSPYQPEDLLLLLDSETQILASEFTPEQETRRTEIAESLGSVLHQNPVKNYDTFCIALECLRLDRFNSDIMNQLIWGLSFSANSKVVKIEIIVRASRQSGEYVIPFLQQSAMLPNEELQAVSIACLAQKFATNEIAALKARELVRTIGIDLPVLANEVCHHVGKSVLDEPNISKLREFIKDIYIAINGPNIHKLKAKDSTGRWAYYFILVEPKKEEGFLAALDSKQNIDLEEHGQIVASNYGENPSDDIRDFLKKKYNFDV